MLLALATSVGGVIACELPWLGNADAPPPPPNLVGATASQTDSTAGAPSGEDRNSERAPAGPGADLIESAPVQIIVSSTADPAQRGPEAMIDDRLETSWASATGELEGSWIALLVPEGARMTSVKLVPGPSADDEASFSKSHRISKVQVTRDGSPVGSFSLDTKRPELQRLPLSGPAGLYKLQVVELDRGDRRAAERVAVTELEVWGVAGEASGRRLARVGSAAGEHSPLVSSKNLLRRTPRVWESEDGRVPDEDLAYQRLVQGDWGRPVRLLRLVELTGEYGDRVFVILYQVDEAADETPEPSRRGCVERFCPSVYLARVSLPATGFPTVDRRLRAASDACTVSSEFDLRDVDGDHRDEIIVGLETRTHRRCQSGGGDQRRSELIVDLDSFEEQYRGDLMLEPAGRCREQRHSERVIRDLNDDGHRDFLIKTTLSPTRCPGVERAPARRFLEAAYLYDAGHDRWRLQP